MRDRGDDVGLPTLLMNCSENRGWTFQIRWDIMYAKFGCEADIRSGAKAFIKAATGEEDTYHEGDRCYYNYFISPVNWLYSDSCIPDLYDGQQFGDTHILPELTCSSGTFYCTDVSEQGLCTSTSCL